MEQRFSLQTCVRDPRAVSLLRLSAAHGESARFHPRDHGHPVLPGRALVNHLQKHVRLRYQGKHRRLTHFLHVSRLTE